MTDTTTAWPPCPDLTVDLVVIAAADRDPHVLLVRRGDAPYQGCHALPGGYTVAGESLATAAVRETGEETGLHIDGGLVCLGVYDDPHRDPRGHVVTVAFATTLPAVQDVRAGDDAAAAHWFPLGPVLRGEILLAFDHHRILRDAADQLGVTTTTTAL